jgi:diguanylate cyclase (GGDEF)-like protein/PAS domain S-box-containing protein
MTEDSVKLLLRPDLSLVSISGDGGAVLDHHGGSLHNSGALLQTALHDSDRPLLQRWVHELRGGATLRKGHLRIRGGDGVYRVLAVEARPVTHPDGSAGVELTARDPRRFPSPLEIFPSAMTHIIMETSDDFVYFKDRHHILLSASQSMVDLCEGVGHWRDFAGKSDYDIFPEALADRYYILETRVYDGEEVAREIQPFERVDGSRGWVDNRKYPIRGPSGDIIALYGIARDISEQIDALTARAQAASVFDHSAEGIVILDAKGYIVDANPAFLAATGLERSVLIGQSLRACKHGLESHDSYAARWQELARTGFWQGEIESIDVHGERRVEMARYTAIRDDSGDISRYVAMYSDITAIKRHEHELEALARRDPLTGLPNRGPGLQRLRAALAAAADAGTRVTLAYIDIDSFKWLNESRGHDAGDALLAHCARSMESVLRASDTLARVGDDEFIAVLSEPAPGAGASGSVASAAADLAEKELLERLHAAAREPLHTALGEFGCTVSIGVARFPQDADSAEPLLRCADQAMFEAKRRGKNEIAFFTRTARETTPAEHEPVARALHSGEFTLHYQPKVNMRTGQVTGVEALVRWQHPVRGLLLPDEFLPAIEHACLCREFSRWVLRTAIAQGRAWRDSGLELAIAVNVPPAHLLREEFADDLQELLHNGAPPPSLVIEVLERNALLDTPRLGTLIHALGGDGLEFSLDDFGTGFSSLTHLRRLPVAEVKIERSFVRDMLEDRDDASIVAGIAGLCHGLGRRVVAEGVETTAHAAALLDIGCTFGQGNAFSAAIPAADIPAWVAHWRDTAPWSAYADADPAPPRIRGAGGGGTA